MSLTRLLPSLMLATLVAGIAAAPPPAQAQTGIVITDVDLVGIDYDEVTGVLSATGGTASGTFAGQPFTTDIENFQIQLLPDLPGEPCSVLNLELGPIDLDLLGLHVDTSAICLELTAFPEEGILGQLLCALAGGDLLLLPGLLDVLPDILTQSLAQETGEPSALQEDICDGECEILDLALGPVELSLLGLNVYLHNCEDGPVQVCVSASEGEGLLGDLLCGLAGGGGLIDLGDLLALVEAIANIDGIGDLDLTPAQTQGLIRQLTQALRDGDLSNRELNRIVGVIENLIGSA